jgi:hypothetical protein
MVDVNEIEMEIERLEDEPLSYALCAKLADLYIVRDHFKGTVDASRSSSEFLLVCSKAPIEKVLAILDEHLDCIKLLYPREYEAIIERIRNSSP